MVSDQSLEVKHQLAFTLGELEHEGRVDLLGQLIQQGVADPWLKMALLNAVGEDSERLLSGLLASIGCGVTGTYVVVKRIGLISGGIAHTALGGMGVAYYLEQEPLLGAIVAALLAAVLIAWVSLKHGEQEDILISALWAVGMAVGVIFISRTPGYNVDLMSYLFGNVLLVEPRALLFMLILDIVILLVVGMFYKQLLAVSFDEEFARLRGLHTTSYYTLLLCMVALTVVLLLPVVGLILVIALLTLPAAIAVHFTSSLRSIMALSVVLGFIFTSGGLALSYGPDLPAGATIIVLAGGCYMLTLAFSRLRQSRRARSAV